jgi:hypothetical protein
MRANPNLTQGSKTEDRPWSDSYPTPLIPQITHGERYFKTATEIKISCEEPGAEIRYTLDGTDPGMNSARYSAPIILRHSAQLKVRSFIKGSNPSYPASAEFTKLELRKATKKDSLLPGLHAGYFEGYCVKLSDMKKYPVSHSSIVPKFSIGSVRDDRSFGYYFNGWINIPETGVYTFFLNSNDGSNLTVDGQLEVVNDGFHRAQERVCKIELEKGMHAIAVDYFQMGGAKALTLSWAFGDGEKREVPAGVLFHEATKTVKK